MIADIVGGFEKIHRLMLPLLIWNILSFMLVGLDKRKSVKRHWRVRESTLLIVAYAMGGLGSLLGSWWFRHKSKKMKFRILLPLALLCNLAILVFIILYT